MVGNITDALIALDESEYGLYTHLIGEGGTRAAYLINNVVYKIEYDYGHNAHEYERVNFLKATGVPEGYAVPECTLYSDEDVDILAMEYVDGILTGECIEEYIGEPCEHLPGECISPSLLGPLNDIGYDIAHGNIVDTGSVKYLIDCA